RRVVHESKFAWRGSGESERRGKEKRRGRACLLFSPHAGRRCRLPAPGAPANSEAGPKGARLGASQADGGRSSIVSKREERPLTPALSPSMEPDGEREKIMPACT